MAAAVSRSLLRSDAVFSRGAAARLAVGVRPRANTSPVGVSSRTSISTSIFRSPVEMCRVNAVSLLPYHTATASAVLTSMLLVAPRSQAWNIEGL